MSHPTTTLALLDALQEKWHQRFMALSAKDSEKRVGQAVSEAANDLGDIIESYESERLASEETDEPMRTLPEAISSRIVIPPASFSFEMTSDGISPDLYATLTGHPVAVEDDDAVPRPEPADITEEPPVGSRFMDCHGHVWRRGERGWGIEGLIPGSNFDNPWSTVQQYTPLTAPEPTPADVDPDEAGGEGGPEPKAELDEVEALAMDLYHASLLIPPVKEIGPTTWLSWREHEMWLGVARAAREHIEDSLKVYYRDLYDKAEADLARVTKERDEQTRDAIEWRNRYDALREDGALAKAILHSLDFPPSSPLGRAFTAAVTDVLAATDRDTERAES